jgi:glycosyltransferase involved in cell wall biosynthesis
MAERPLTVVQMVPALEAGGVERGTLEVANELVRHGHRSIVISGGGKLVAALTGAGSEHVGWPVGRKSLASLWLVHRLRRFLQEEQVDILHARSRVPAWIAWLAWRRMAPGQRPHFVTTVHGLYSVNAYSRIMTRGERVIAVSDTARRYIIENFPDTDPQKIVSIYRGVDPQAFPRGFRPEAPWLSTWYKQYPLLRERKVLTLPGRLTRLKGHEDFIELLAALVARGLPVHGLIVGHLDPKRERYIAELRHLISDKGLENRITLTGHRADIREIYSVSDVVLSLSSKPESFGRTVLETLRLGVPVIGYDHGGVGEVLAMLYPEGRVPLGAMEALTARAAQLLEAPVDVPPVDAFTLQVMLDQTLQLYEELAR